MFSFNHIRNLLILFAFMSVINGNATADTNSFIFNNFSKKIYLKQISSDFFLMNNHLKVKLTNRMIIKAKANITKAKIQKEDPHIQKVTEIYQMKQGVYYLVEIKEMKNLFSLINHFNDLPFIYFAQPDILQLKQKTSHEGYKSYTNRYIKRLNIPSLWKKTKGEHVKIAIIDDGFDLTHEDLKGLRLAFGYDVEMKTLDPSPKLKIDTHGTQIAGIIFAQHNDTGIDGIAPHASLIAIRHADTWTSQMILSFYVAKMAAANIINCSWTSRFLLEPVADIINDLTSEGRDGKGIAVIFAAGNKGIELQVGANEASLSPVISVGAIDYQGNRLKRSNYGKCVDVYTYGKNIKTTTYSSRKYGFISGTSASAAIVSGICALVLSQNQHMSLAQLNTVLQTNLIWESND